MRSITRVSNRKEQHSMWETAMNLWGSVSMTLKTLLPGKNLWEFAWMDKSIWISKKIKVMKMRILTTIEGGENWWLLTMLSTKILILVFSKSKKKTISTKVRKLKRSIWTVLRREEGKVCILSMKSNPRCQESQRRRKRSFLMTILG